MAHEKVKFYFTFFFAIRGCKSRTFSSSNINKLTRKYRVIISVIIVDSLVIEYIEINEKYTIKNQTN